MRAISDCTTLCTWLTSSDAEVMAADKFKLVIDWKECAATSVLPGKSLLEPQMLPARFSATHCVPYDQRECKSLCHERCWGPYV